MRLKRNRWLRWIPLWIRVRIVAQAAAVANELLHERCWIDEPDFKGWRWDRYNVKRVIVCAANRYGDFIVTGSRHFSVPMWFTLELIGDDALKAYGKCEQGFIDQYGMFWNRTDAYNLCREQGRELLEEGGSETELFSEHLY
ncbi:hypothetical protein [Pseudomonas phage D6]|nr:hypothetical protein [Pseudomonas phage D6]